MPTTETTADETARRVREAREACDDLAEILRIHCDDPRGIRAELDDFAGRIYHDADDLNAEPWHGNLRHLGNAAWAVVDALDRLRDEADALHAAMLETID
jgi:hypothetical protein